MLFFDIETEALDIKDIPVIPEFKAPKNYKDPEKIRAAIEMARLTWDDERALSPLTARVLVVGTLRDDQSDPHLLDNEDEVRNLEDWWAMYSEQVYTNQRIYGFCIRKFDVPFLMRRSWIRKVKVPNTVMNGRYLTDAFVDLADVWACGNQADYSSLSDTARALRLGAKDESGKDFAKLWRNPKTRNKANAYLTNDLNLTRDIARALGVC